MGIIVPEDLALGSLDNEAERRVVESLRDGLDDGWLILPDVAFAGYSQHHQLDVVLVHQELGIVDIEVKGHRVVVERGRWRDDRGVDLVPQPSAQARNNAFALRDLLRERFPELRHLHVDHGVALPNTRAIEGSVGPDLERHQVLTAAELDEPLDPIERIATGGYSSVRLDAGMIEQIVAFLRPDADFDFDPTARQRRARARLDELSATQVDVLRHLDANRRVVVRGAAGTGKSRLAAAWAQRAILRDERVLLTCFNEPLAGHLADSVIEDDDLVVAPFLRWALDHPELDPLEPSDHDLRHWWSVTVPGDRQANWHRITQRFDTIIVDEAQDFSPIWLAMLEGLLDPEGPGRMLLLADPAQVINPRGFVIPATRDGWVHAELTANCRNAREIARLLRRRLGGAPAPAVSPDAVGLHFLPSGEPGDTDAAVATVRSELDRLLGEERDPAGIMVLCFRNVLRDRLLDELGLRPWEERELGIVGQTVHRAKGIEADTVILVSDREEEREELLYVGCSRAVSELILVGPRVLGDRLGLAAADDVAG